MRSVRRAAFLTVLAVLSMVVTATPGASRSGDRLTGKAMLRGRRPVSYAFELHCDLLGRPNRLVVRWGRRAFRLSRVAGAQCVDRPSVPSSSRFDTHRGSGPGRLDGRAGFVVNWSLTDGGRGGARDVATLVIRNRRGKVVLSVKGRLRDGDHAARRVAYPAPGVDAPGLVNRVVTDERGVSGSVRTTKAPEGYQGEPDEAEKTDDGREVEPEKLHPQLQEMLETGNPDERVEVLVNLVGGTPVPRLPDLPFGVSRGSPLGERIRKRTGEVIAGLRAERRKEQGQVLGTLADRYGLEVEEDYWLVNAVLATVALGATPDLAKHESVRYVQPRFETTQPPDHDGNTTNDVADGRSQIASDPYYNLYGMTGGYIGLIDSGVRHTHTLFSSPNDNLAFVRDCVNGGTSCNNTSAPNYNTADCWNHGTSSAAIVVGNANKGGAHRGVTDMTLDSWKVFPDQPPWPGRTCGGGLDAAAAVRAFQAGLAVADRVFVGEMQSGEAFTGVVSTAADAAFDAGAVVISAAGNNGPNPGSINAPGGAHKVIGVGAYTVTDTGKDTALYQSRGPTTDNRYKPDIQAPTDSETAGANSDTSMRPFGGTSGATPFAAGAGALTRNWLKKHGTFDPGATYSRLILAGQRTHPYDNEEGAGDLVLPTCSTSYWGKVNVSYTTHTIDIPIGVPAGRPGIEASLWWPEGAAEAHDDVDLYLLNPSGSQVANAYSAPSVFERAGVAGPLAGGTWKVRIKGYDIVSGPQPVYWTARVKGC